MRDVFREAAQAIKQSSLTIAVTGAGISAESGIPTFRGVGGIWQRYSAEEYATLSAYIENPGKVWPFWMELAGSLQGCKPNPGHYALAELERMGLLQAIITQNIDNLHEDAGSQRVIEYHGNSRWLACPRCGHRERLDLTRHMDFPPHCTCGVLMKPDIVMFGELIPRDAMNESDRLAGMAQVVIVVGTSAQVYPAADLPIMARQNGAFIIEANVEETDFTSMITNAFLRGPSGETLPRLVETIKNL